MSDIPRREPYPLLKRLNGVFFCDPQRDGRFWIWAPQEPESAVLTRDELILLADEIRALASASKEDRE